MAIQLDVINSGYGVPFLGTYFQIHSAHITRTGDPTMKFSVVMDVYGFLTTTPEENTRFVSNRRYTANLTDIEAQVGDNFLSKCYIWVMAQPDMAGSQAV